MTSRKIPESAVENLVSDLEGKVDKTSTQTISGSKRFTKPSGGMSIELVADTNQQTVPATATLRQLGLYRNSTYTKGDGYTSWIQGSRGSDGHTSSTLYTQRFLESDSQEIINYLQSSITSDGTPVSYTRTPPVGVTGEEIVTAGWFRQSGCIVRTVIETYVNGTNWYRVWSDGFVEQGGSQVFPFGSTTITLLIPANILNVSGIRATINHTTPESNPMIGILEDGAKIQINTGSGAAEYFFWKVEGYRK